MDFHDRPDTYNCEKKVNYYVLNYGPSFASEIYHYFSTSQVLENNFNNTTLNILSLGCGFSPELIALERYIRDYHLTINFNYRGIDSNQSWNNTRLHNANAQYIIDDVSHNINLIDMDIVFVIKLFSTLYKNNLSNQFLSSLRNAISSQLKANGLLIFIDVNSIHMGRDIFHNSVSNLFTKCYQYYSGINPPYSEYSWTRINQQNIVFTIPNNLSISPLPNLRNNIFFEYWK